MDDQCIRGLFDLRGLVIYSNTVLKYDMPSISNAQKGDDIFDVCQYLRLGAQANTLTYNVYVTFRKSYVKGLRVKFLQYILSRSICMNHNFQLSYSIIRPLTVFTKCTESLILKTKRAVRYLLCIPL